jgi:hypothetical protein
MPDIKTEMSKVLSAWEKDEQATQRQPNVITIDGKLSRFGITNNVSRETFNYVRDNPNSTGKQIMDALEARGFTRNSVGSLLTQCSRQGLIARKDNGQYIALASEYQPLKASKQLYKEKAKAKAAAKNKASKPAKPKPKLEQGIAALKVEPRVEEKPTIKTAWDAETVINNIGLKQAHALYKELGKYFGG